MTVDQKNDSLIAFAEAVRLHHTQAGLAAALGISQQHVSRMFTGAYVVDAVIAVKIEQLTKGKIKRHELRPDLWGPSKHVLMIIDPLHKYLSGEHVVGAVLGEPSTPARKGKANGKTRSWRKPKEKGKVVKGREPRRRSKEQGGQGGRRR